jgi:hypothetical protein
MMGSRVRSLASSWIEFAETAELILKVLGSKKGLQTDLTALQLVFVFALKLCAWMHHCKHQEAQRKRHGSNGSGKTASTTRQFHRRI